MATNKRITDLTDYTSVLPYASELFGIYQPLIGWKSKRIVQRMNRGIYLDNMTKFRSILSRYKGIVSPKFDGCSINIHDYQVGVENSSLLIPQNSSLLLSAISNLLSDFGNIPQNEQEWTKFFNQETLKSLLNEDVFKSYKKMFEEQCANFMEVNNGVRNHDLQREVVNALNTESAIAAALLAYADNKLFDKLKSIFYASSEILKAPLNEVFDNLKQSDYHDPYLTFDPKKDIKDVCLSPIGIVHLYRQYFFELDTFLGTPVSHVWLSPGSSVELIEASSRKTITEKTIETSIETTSKSEKSTTDQDEISEAVKQDNRDDTKLGFSTTVNQSWATGNASASGSLNMDKTQQVARENTQKRTRQQTEKLSTEIRQNFKTTFKTITEVTDTTSKRYLLNNSTQNLINYELRRKMRQVGVQIQDVGSYLCWETFIDEPGAQLGLPNLVHIAQPADLVMVPSPTDVAKPKDNIIVGFSGKMTWLATDKGRKASEDSASGKKIITLNSLDLPNMPDGYQVMPNTYGILFKISHQLISAQDNEYGNAYEWDAQAVISGAKILVGFTTLPGGIGWDKRMEFSVQGNIYCELTQEKKSQIADEIQAKKDAKKYTEQENMRKTEEAYKKAAEERITLASKIKKRKFENLREEERTIVYRNLIKSLMTDNNYTNTDATSGYEARHVLSELINSIFDIDKMLYFVAPEWWKPRNRHLLSEAEQMGRIGSDYSIVQTINNIQNIDGKDLNWADQPYRIDNYFISENSEPAPLGSSLGWLLQLDGDDLRNAFLNAPWVKAVIPIRPGKEKAAIAWLQNVGVEGADGLNEKYLPPDDELIRINVYRNTGKVPKQFSDAEWEAITATTTPDEVKIKDALDFLCAEVTYKEESSKDVYEYNKGVKGKKIVGKARNEEINDDNKVLATPIEKVYEHGFYPLRGGFRAVVEDNFEIISQWIEVLPTDQIVPVEVKYDPKTGRQM